MEGGKSTLVGVLTQGELDNGRGRARLNLFRHLHEIQSGRTSSISHEILGFDAKGEVSEITSPGSFDLILANQWNSITLILESLVQNIDSHVFIFPFFPQLRLFGY